MDLVWSPEAVDNLAAVGYIESEPAGLMAAGHLADSALEAPSVVSICRIAAR